MPLHAIHSTVKPAYVLYGKGLGYGFKDNATAFPRSVISVETACGSSFPISPAGWDRTRSKASFKDSSAKCKSGCDSKFLEIERRSVKAIFLPYSLASFYPSWARIVARYVTVATAVVGHRT